MRLNRKQLKKLIRIEARLINEQEDAIKAVIDLNTNHLRMLNAAYENDGIGGFFDEAARQGIITGKQIWQLATDEQLQQEMENALENEGAEAAYVLWVNKLKSSIH